MTDRTACGGLQVATELYRFINEEAIPGTGIDASKFWAGVDALIHELAPVNRELVAKRDVIQEKIDAFHKARRGQAHNAAEYKAFLEEIGYLLPEPQNVSVSTDNVDPEVATTAGPQLVVPVMNARYALNAANARWGSLYNALPTKLLMAI
jgi:malate synthase